MVCDTKLYDCLGVPPDASINDITQAGRKLSRQWHPDKNAHQIELAEAKFKEIRQALEILSDPEKRNLYDRMGMEALSSSSSSGGGGGGPFPFGGFPFPFGGGAVRGIEVSVNVTLEQIAREETVTISFARRMSCTDCDGQGSRNKAVCDKCKSCNGQGVVHQSIQIGPNLFQQAQRACPTCRGLGKNIPIDQVCPGCQGKGGRQVTVRAPFALKSRMVPYTTIPFQHDGVMLLVTLKETVHEVFHRDSRRPLDLHLTLELNLHEALFGFTKRLYLPDRRVVQVQFVGKTPYGTQRKVIGAGLGDEGNLILTFEFELPSVGNIPDLLRRFQDMKEMSQKEEEKSIDDDVIGMAMVDVEPNSPDGESEKNPPQTCRPM